VNHATARLLRGYAKHVAPLPVIKRATDTTWSAGTAARDIKRAWLALSHRERGRVGRRVALQLAREGHKAPLWARGQVKTAEQQRVINASRRAWANVLATPTAS